MTPAWDDFVAAVGGSENSVVLGNLIKNINEIPVVELSPLGDRKYFSLFSSGVLFVIENGRVVQISFFIQPHDGFFTFRGDLPGGMNSAWVEEDIVSLLGSPVSAGGGRQDLLIGFVHRWIKYKLDGIYLHIELSKDSKLRKLSLMCTEQVFT